MKKSIIAMLIFAYAFCAANQETFAQKSQANSKTETGKLASSINYDQMIDRYFESLNEPEDKRRGALVEQVWTPDGVFVYPGSEVKGLAAISADVLKVQKMYPQAIVRRTGNIEILEKKYIRFKWEFGVPNEDILISGVDFAVFADDGKLKLVVGYFDFISEKAKR